MNLDMDNHMIDFEKLPIYISFLFLLTLEFKGM
jgi:hypothetical protein